MGKILNDCIKIQKMNGVYDTPLGEAARKMMAEFERKLEAKKKKKKEDKEE